MSRKEDFYDVKVYNMNDVDYVASKWDKERTLKHYIKEFNLFEFEDEYDLDCIEELDLDQVKIRVECINPMGTYKTVSLREELEEIGVNWDKPFLIASTEY